MIDSRFALVVFLALVAGVPSTSMAGGDGSSGRPVRMDPARVRQLVQIVLAEPDEQKRRAAVLELGRADPRHTSEVMPAVAQALLKDTSATVRLTAVEVIVAYRSVFAFAGLALESAVDSDPSAVVRAAARQALWEYHLMGYKSARACEKLFPQTPEPPRARPAPMQAPVTVEPPVRAAAAQLPPAVMPQLPAVVPQLPAAEQSPGPRVFLMPPGPLAMLMSISPHANLTVEPPFAPMPSNLATTLPTTPNMIEPPILPPAPEPLPFAVATPPPSGLSLPPIVADPGPIPGVTPDPSVEPPIRKR